MTWLAWVFVAYLALGLVCLIAFFRGARDGIDPSWQKFTQDGIK